MFTYVFYMVYFFLRAFFQETGWRGGTFLHSLTLRLIKPCHCGRIISCYLLFVFLLLSCTRSIPSVSDQSCMLSYLTSPWLLRFFHPWTTELLFLGIPRCRMFLILPSLFGVGLSLGPWPIGNLPSFLLMDGCMYIPFYIVAIWMVCRLDASRLFISF